MNTLRSYLRIIIDRYEFMGFHGRLAWCALEILTLADGRTVVIATELKDNPGASITNACEHLAVQVCRDFGIDPPHLVWIEHYGYPSATYALDPRPFDLVSLDVIACKNGEVLVNPRWRRMTDADWIGLGLPPRQPVDYG